MFTMATNETRGQQGTMITHLITMKCSKSYFVNPYHANTESD